MKNLLLIPFFLTLLKMSIINVIAVSNVSVKTKNPDISIDLSIYYTEGSCDVRELYFKHPWKPDEFFKPFSNDRGAFQVNVKAYATTEAGVDAEEVKASIDAKEGKASANMKLCGTLEISRSTEKIHIIRYEFTPSPEMQKTPACQNSGFKLELVDDMNSRSRVKKIPFSSEQRTGHFMQDERYNRDQFASDFDVSSNIVVYKER